MSNTTQVTLSEKAKASIDNGKYDWISKWQIGETKRLIELGAKHGFMDGYLVRQDEELAAVDAQLQAIIK